MLTIFKRKKDIPEGTTYVELNDLFFNQNTAVKLDEKAKVFIEKIDGSKMVGRFKIESKFNRAILDIDCLSTGCKTVLNVLYHPDIVFCIKECGENALESLYQLEHGLVFSDYAMIPFKMNEVHVLTHSGLRTITDYDDLKEWWDNEE